MLSLVLALALTQAAEPTAPPASEPPLPAPTELPPEARLTPQPAPPPGPSMWTRSLLSTGAGMLGTGAALGISMLLIGQNPRFDPIFANAALGALLVTGAVFTVHEALGGRGEITLAFLACAVVTAGAAGLAIAIDPSRDVAPYVTSAIGAIPASIAAVIALEGTNPKPKRGVQLTVMPNGVSGTF
ncbi:MAG: hypothetical protein U0228_35795 [Myxococcaceae bacterium]